MKTLQEVRQKIYENIVDETMFVARASEGAVSAEWLMNQPIFIRKKYVEQFTKELKASQFTKEELSAKARVEAYMTKPNGDSQKRFAF